MSNDAFLQIAIRDISSEAERGISLTCQKTFEVALADAENGRIIHAELSRKGGKAFRSDALQGLIRQFVSQNSDISHTQLLDMLRGEVGAGVIDSIDEESSLLEGDVRSINFVGDDGRPKKASVYGLKDRLSREKRKIKGTNSL